tara:strand:+ start:4285 stop:4776 length:492 start_codon:yes stop_codon:yes gene_type:complete
MSKNGTCARWHPKIESAIRKAQNKAAKLDKPFKLNMKALASDLNTSRPTLYKHEKFIEALCDRLRVERRRVDGQASVDLLKDQIHRKEQKIQELEVRNAALMRDMQAIYDHIYGASITAGELVDAEVRRRSTEDGQCVLCDAPVQHALGKETNIVSINPKDRT